MENNEKNKNKTNALSKFMNTTKKLFLKDKHEFTAEFAWIETRYGIGSFRPLEERISYKQKNIMHLSESKFSTKRDGHTTININGEYHCLVEIEDDLVNSTEEIFTPFINAGFKVINLSDKIDEILYDSCEDIEEATRGMAFASSVNKWDKYVAFNAFHADTCKVLDEDEVIKAAYHFWFADEDAPEGKVWIYMCAMSKHYAK